MGIVLPCLFPYGDPSWGEYVAPLKPGWVDGDRPQTGPGGGHGMGRISIQGNHGGIGRAIQSPRRSFSRPL